MRKLFIVLMILILAIALRFPREQQEIKEFSEENTSFQQTYKISEDLEKIIAQKIFEQINEIRVKNNLPPLKWNETLERVAQAHAEDMARRNYFSHESPEGKTFRDRLTKAGYVPRIISQNGAKIMVFGGENLFLFGGTPESADQVVNEAIKGWMSSKGHRENILRKEFALTGIGVEYDEDGCFYENQTFEICIYIVQMFG